MIIGRDMESFDVLVKRGGWSFTVHCNLPITALSHDYGDWTVTAQPTELSTGARERSCRVCSHKESGVVAALPPTLPAVKISKPKAAKKAATVKWKKVAKKNVKKVKSIQIQYSQDRSFTAGVKTVSAKAKNTSKKIKGLASGKTYYVRIRAYNGGHISSWSAVKALKAK